MTQRRAYYCDHPGCDAYASRGFTAPHGFPKPPRPLWACPDHVEWAHARWIAKYHPERATEAQGTPAPADAKIAASGQNRASQGVLL